MATAGAKFRFLTDWIIGSLKDVGGKATFVPGFNILDSSNNIIDSFSGGGGGTSGGTATAASPTYSEGATNQPLSLNLKGAVRFVQQNPDGTDLDTTAPAQVTPASGAVFTVIEGNSIPPQFAVSGATYNVGTGVAAFTANAQTVDLDVTKGDAVFLQFYGTFVASLRVRFSNDGTNWDTALLTRVDGTKVAAGTPVTSAGQYVVQALGMYMRLETTAYTSGTANVKVVAGALGSLPTSASATTAVSGTSASGAADDGSNPVKFAGVFVSGTLPSFATGQRANIQSDTYGNVRSRLVMNTGGPLTGFPSNVIGYAQPANSGSEGNVVVQAIANTKVFGTSMDSERIAYATRRLVSSAASTNATSVTTTTTHLFKLTVGNTQATKRYLKLYDKASAPTVGTDVPVFTFPLPQGQLDLNFVGGHRFASGLAYALTANAADTDTTAVAAGDIECLNFSVAN